MLVLNVDALPELLETAETLILYYSNGDLEGGDFERLKKAIAKVRELPGTGN